MSRITLLTGRDRSVIAKFLREKNYSPDTVIWRYPENFVSPYEFTDFWEKNKDLIDPVVVITQNLEFIGVAAAVLRETDDFIFYSALDDGTARSMNFDLFYRIICERGLDPR